MQGAPFHGPRPAMSFSLSYPRHRCDRGQLPLPELVVMDEEGGEVEDQAVSHVDNAQNLDKSK